MRGRTHLRTIFSKPKFLGYKDITKVASMVLRCKKLWYATRQPRYLLFPFTDKTTKSSSNTSLHSKRISNSSRTGDVFTSRVVISRLSPPKGGSLQRAFPCAPREIILYLPAVLNYGHRNLFFVVGYGKVQHILVILV